MPISQSVQRGSRLRPIPGLVLLSTLDVAPPPRPAESEPEAVDPAIVALVRARCQVVFEVLIRSRPNSLIHWPAYSPFINKMLRNTRLRHPAGKAVEITHLDPDVSTKYDIRFVNFHGIVRTGGHAYAFVGKVVGKTLVELQII